MTACPPRCHYLVLSWAADSSPGHAIQDLGRRRRDLGLRITARQGPVTHCLVGVQSHWLAGRERGGRGALCAYRLEQHDCVNRQLTLARGFVLLACWSGAPSIRIRPPRRRTPRRSCTDSPCGGGVAVTTAVRGRSAYLAGELGMRPDRRGPGRRGAADHAAAVTTSPSCALRTKGWGLQRVRLLSSKSFILKSLCHCRFSGN